MWRAVVPSSSTSHYEVQKSDSKKKREMRNKVCQESMVEVLREVFEGGLTKSSPPFWCYG
jgi:hypothetical protein